VPHHTSLGELPEERQGENVQGLPLLGVEVVGQLAVLPQAAHQAHPDALMVEARSVRPHGLQVPQDMEAPVAVHQEVVANVQQAPGPALPPQDISRF
jgi:hypothetical protein